MWISEHYVHVRQPNYGEKAVCVELVRDNWGDEAAERCHEQFIEYFKDGKYSPIFCVATDDDSKVIGFAAYHRTMLMKGAFDLIWIAVDKKYQDDGVGRALTDWRLNEIDEQHGQMIQLVTQKTGYFARFGFSSVADLGNGWYLMLKLLVPGVNI